MKKMYIIIIATVVLIIVSLYVYKNHNNFLHETHYTDPEFGISLDYPSNWNLITRNGDKNILEYEFIESGFTHNSIGKWLEIKIMKVAQNSTPLLLNCPTERKSGLLTINGKKYDRCDYGSGLHLYRINFREKIGGSDMSFDFQYNSAGNDTTDTKTIETIIRSLKF